MWVKNEEDAWKAWQDAEAAAVRAQELLKARDARWSHQSLVYEVKMARRAEMAALKKWEGANALKYRNLCG